VLCPRQRRKHARSTRNEYGAGWAEARCRPLWGEGGKQCARRLLCFVLHQGGWLLVYSAPALLTDCSLTLQLDHYALFADTAVARAALQRCWPPRLMHHSCGQHGCHNTPDQARQQGGPRARIPKQTLLPDTASGRRQTRGARVLSAGCCGQSWRVDTRGAGGGRDFRPTIHMIMCGWYC
jgi:hypothetical protein